MCTTFHPQKNIKKLDQSAPIRSFLWKHEEMEQTQRSERAHAPHAPLSVPRQKLGSPRQEQHFLPMKTGVITVNYLFGGDQTMQIYGDFGGFPF